MISYVATVKEKSRRIAIAILNYPDNARTCLAAAESVLSEKLGVERFALHVSYLSDLAGNKNFVLPEGVPVFDIESPPEPEISEEFQKYLNKVRAKA